MVHFFRLLRAYDPLRCRAFTRLPLPSVLLSFTRTSLCILLTFNQMG